MSTRSNQMAFALSSAVILVILCGGKAFCQSTASPKPATNSSPSVVHYHYHYHYHPRMSSLLYPRFDADPYNGMAPNARYPLPPTAFSPTQANPYPAGYIPARFADGFPELESQRAKCPRRNPRVLADESCGRVLERAKDARHG